MVDYLAFRILPTYSRTRILTFISNTCFVRWTVGNECTFRSTAFIRISNIIWQTNTRTCTILFPALCINTTRGRNTGRRSLHHWQFKFFLTMNEWITNKSNQTGTIGCVTDDFTLCICATYTNAWVFTLLINTSQIVRTF